MGLDIRTYKIGKHIEEEAEDMCVYLQNGLECVSHLTEYQEGYYEYKHSKHHLHIGYGQYYWFRNAVCRAMFNIDVSEYWNSDVIRDPFRYFLNTCDCGGSIDYKCAELMLTDFNKYKDDILFKCPDVKDAYERYMFILEYAIKNNEVIVYS